MAKHFNKTTFNFWLDACLLGAFLTYCWISVVIRYVFPNPLQSDGWRLWGMDYLAWSDAQFGVLCVLAAGILLHVMMHWSWVCGVIGAWAKKRGKHVAPAKADAGGRTLWGVGFLIAILNLLGVGIAAAALSIQGPTP